jgi:hypothetical protein
MGSSEAGRDHSPLTIHYSPFTKFFHLPARWFIIWESTSIGGSMIKLPNEEGQGWIEWILIGILAILVLVTIYLLMRPALTNLWQNFIQSLQ